MGILTFLPVLGVSEIKQGDSIAQLICRHAADSSIAIADGDVVIVKSKVVSKAEGRVVKKADVIPSAFALETAVLTGREPEYMEVVLRETKRIVKMDKGVLISQTRHGFVMANAGVDSSNAGEVGDYLLLPENPDKTAEEIRQGIKEYCNAEIAVIISDTFGRPWRMGQTDLAIGVSGMEALNYLTGSKDCQGKELKYTASADADALAAAAELVCRKTLGIPFVIVKGCEFKRGEGKGADLIMSNAKDMFR